MTSREVRPWPSTPPWGGREDPEGVSVSDPTKIVLLGRAEEPVDSVAALHRSHYGPETPSDA